MNRVFRIIWSKSLNTWVIVSELATRCGKSTGVDKRIAAMASALERIAAGNWRLRLGTMAMLLALYAPAQAADRWWDPNNTAVGLGGSGIWNTTDPFWSPNNDGVSGPYSAWNNAALDDAFFSGTPTGTVTLGGPITVHNITLGGGYTLTGNTLTLGGVTPTISVASGSATISSAIAGSAGLTKADGGNLFLTGTNTFTGNVNVNGGRLDASGNAALGNIANIINMATGTRLDVGSTGGGLAGRTVSLTGNVSLFGSGVGSGFFTGSGNASFNSVALSNNLNNYTGRTSFSSGASTFTSIADLGMVSSLGAPTTAADGVISVGGPTQTNAILDYVGDGDTSNRDWQLNPPAGPSGEAVYLRNGGTGTLTLTGNIALGGGSGNRAQFQAISADMELLGVISSNNIGRDVWFVADANRTIRLGDANTFGGRAVVRGAGEVQAGTIANSGIASSLGAGSIINISAGGTLSYTGAGASTDRNWQMGGSTLNNDGSGALTLSGPVNVASGTATLGGSFTGADNAIAGVIDGTGNLRSGGDSTWVLTGANTYTGTTIVDSGVLRAGTANAFGASTVAQVNGGTLDLNGFDRTFSTLSGTGGTVDLGSATLTLEAPTGTTASYAGSIAGSGGLTKLGASTQTLTGANTYTGATTIGGGTLNLNFSPAGGPTSNIISSASTLNMSGGTLNVIGAAGESNTQTFNGLNISAGNNIVGATAGSGGSTTVNLGTITRTGGLMNFNLPASGNITTTSTVLGGWATVNGTDYAKVVGGNITAFTAADYTNKDNAANWLNNEFITDATGFFGTVSGSVQLGGLRYTRPVSTTVTVNPGETLGVDGTIIVAPSVLNTNQTITGGMLTGANGGDLGIQQNSTGTFFINSQIVDNGSSMGFVKAGTGGVALGNANNSYTGATQVVQGTLSVSNIGNGGVASNIGASSADSANLVLEGATLRYTSAAATTTSDRGFTIAKSGGLGSGIDVTNPSANLTFTGLVTSPDDATFTKSGPGTLTLANGANDYVGGTIVTGGLLSVNTLANGGQVSGIGRSSSASANLVLDGGGLQYTGATATTNRGMTLGLNDGTIDVTDGGTTLTVSGTVAGSGGGAHSLTKEGDGTLVLSGTNTYVGFTTVNGGVLRAGSTQAFGTPNTANVMTLANAAGVTLDLDGFDNFVGPLNGGGASGGNVTLGSATLRIGGGGGSYSGTISGTGGILRTDGGTQIFNGCNNTYTGATILQGSNLQVDCLADGGVASGIGASTSAAANLSLSSSVLLYTGGSVDIDRGFTLAGGAGAIEVANAATTLGFGGIVAGGGTLDKRGAGTLVLSGNNTYASNTIVRGGTLRAGVINAFGPSGHMTLDNTAGVLLDLAGFNTAVTSLIGGGANGGNVNLGGATLTINSVDTRDYAGAISGTGNLIKNGAGTQTLSGCNSSYSGTTTINAGVLAVNCLENGGVNSSIGASTAGPANLVLNGGTLSYVGAGGSTDRQFTLDTNGGTLDASGSGVIEFASTAPVTLAGANTARTFTLSGSNSGDNLFAAQLDNNGAGVTSLTKTGTGTWRLSNDNSTYTGITTISGGVLSVDQLADGGMASSIGASSNAAANLVIGNGSTLRYTGAGDTTNRQFTLATGVTFIESSGTGALQFTNTGAVTLSGANTARTIALGGTNTGDNTMGGAMGDNGTGKTTLAKNDSGTWVLTGNNTYTGNTVINDGNLVIGDGGTTGNAGAGNVIIDSATSTLSINRSDTFNFNGTLSGPGTLAQIGTGTTTLTSASNSVGATTISAGTLDVNGGLTTPTIAMSGTSTLNVDGTVQGAGGAMTDITGDAGVSTINVNAGGTLLAGGNLGGGNDVVNVSGTLSTAPGVLSLGDGDDTLALNDGAAIGGAGFDAGNGTDIVQINNAAPVVFGGTDITGFESLVKQNTGLLTLSGNHAYSANVQVTGGTLDVDGALTTPTLTLADDTTLNVDGTVEAAGAAPTAIAGSGGVNTISVNAGATLRGNGDLGNGNDVVTLSGLLDTGAAALALGNGDDTLTLNDGAMLAGTGIDAGAATTNDVLVLNNALALMFDGSQTSGFEQLVKQNAGTATMTGSQTFSAGVALNGGALDIDGTLIAPTVAMADGTTLTIDGVMSGPASTAAAITGSNGENTVVVNGTALANGDLGTGNDVLDVAGTLDTGAGAVLLGDGDDTLTIHDGTNIIGTVVAGTGNDTFDTNIAGVADLGAVQGFETLSKTGAGLLNVNGPLSSDFATVNVLAGILNVTAGGSVVGQPGQVLTATVASGATLDVDGSYGCGAGADTMTVGGTVSGSGTIDLCAGNDTLTLTDGAVLANVISGGADNDTVVLDTAGAATFNIGNATSFEILQKDNIGAATLTGSAIFTGGTLINDGTLRIAGDLTTPTVTMADNTTLAVDGILQGAGGAAAMLAGSAGVNTVTVAGTAIAGGDLGDGADVLDIVGTLDTDGGVFALGNGDDQFVVHDGTVVVGIVDGGVGLDSRVYNINLNADLGALVNFEGVTKTGTGTLNIAGPGATDLQEISVLGGTLNVAGGASVVATAGSALNTVVASGATLNVEGSFGCGAGNDTMSVSGTVSGGGTIDQCDGEDILTLNDGAVLNAVISGGAHGTGDTVVLNNANALAFDATNTINYEFLQKDNTGTATLTGTQSFIGGTTLNAGTLTVAGTLDTPTVTLGDDTTLNIDGTLQAAGGTVATITGSAGANTVAVTGTLLASGDLGAGNDVLDVAGTLDTAGGTFLLGDGDDTLTIHDGTDIIGTVVAGAGNDTFNADIATSADLGAVQSFETLSKTDVGVLNINGPMPSEFTTVNVLGGTLNVTAGGSVSAQTTTVAAGSTLQVDGVYTGTAGADVLDVAGTLDLSGGTLALGNGDDTFTIHDGTHVIGTVDGGAGMDSRVYDINLSADLGALANFEGVTKTGTGTLHINGLGATDLQEVEVLGGTLNIGAGASVVATAGSALNTVVASGATLKVDGSFGCGDSDDSTTVAGTVSGTGTIDMCGGEDVLTLQDGAVLANIISGGSHGSGDTVVLDTADAFTFDATNTVNFEYLQKDNTGEATLVGTQSFTGGTTVNGGTLTVDGRLETPTVAMADDTVLNVDGALDSGAGTPVAITGSAGANTVTVGEGGTLLATGDLGGGNDVLDVAGTLDIDGGTFELGDGDDTLTIHDDTNIVGTVVAGAGNDTFNADIDTVADLGAVQDFETLSKTGAGELNVNGPMSSDFTTINVLGGTLDVTAGGSVVAQTTTVAGGATLNVDGSYAGTDGDDNFTSMGTVRGAFTFGDGNDAVAFIGGDPSDVTALTGGIGSDLLSFSGLELEGETLPALTGWERMELLNGSALALGSALDLEGGVLAIDATSQLFANAGAAIGGSVENAGLIDTGANRLAIGGDYSGNDGVLQLSVSPGTLSAGGLDIDGDVLGTTRVSFAGDGSDIVGGGTASILVISSPNDNTGTAGSFVPADTTIDGTVRLNGSVFPWAFGQAADNNWYLGAEAGLLPEVPGYAVLPSIGLAGMEESNRLLFQRLSGVRGEEPHCERRDEDSERAYASLIGDCRGVWMAATGSELEMGADPGFEFSGDNLGLFVGVDQLFHDRGTRTFRGGVYAGGQRGNYWTTGVNSTELPGAGTANVRTDTLTVGMYGSANWDSGGYLDASWVAQLASADVATADGFSEHLSGNNMAASLRGGRLFGLGNGWSIEPQFELKAVAAQWGDKMDAAGKQISFDDDVLGRARLGARVEKRHITASGARVRYWTTLGLQDTFGEKDQLVGIAPAGSEGETMWLPNHQLDLTATLDVGVEVELRNNVSLFGVLSVDQDVNGSDYEQRAANLGIRVRW